MSKIIRYSQWSLRHKGATPNSHPMGGAHGVSLHWEGPGLGNFSHSECAGKVRGIQAYHRDQRGWADIAYSAVVCPHGYVFEGRGPGTAVAANGYASANYSWYAVCYLGGEGDDFTEGGKSGFIRAVQWLREAGPCGDRVNGHRDHKATQCPGWAIYRWLQEANFNTPPQKEDDDMPLNDSDKRWIRNAFQQELQKFLDGPANKHRKKGEPRFRGKSLRWLFKQPSRLLGRKGKA